MRNGRENRPDRREQPATSLNESIGQFLRAEGLGDLETLTRVRSLWPNVVGEHVSQHAQPESLRSGELRVVVDQPAWATELRFLAGDIISELQRQLGNAVVSALKVHVRA